MTRLQSPRGPKMGLRNLAFLLTATSLSLALTPSLALACACGCGVFDVTTSAMMPTQPGGMAFLEYDFMDQNHNWSGTSKASAADNDDKQIRSNFVVAGAQYMFDRSWGIEASVPYTERYFRTADGGPVESFDHSSIGDIRVQGIYSGFSSDMSTGVTFGFKLPTGDFKQSGFDRDVQIGSGSTNVLLGAYHMGNLVTNTSWNWFASGELDQPFATQGDYRPGTEIDATTGVYYNGWVVGNTVIAPLARIIGSQRWSDHGAASDPDNSGYSRLLVAPGLEVNTGAYKLYGDAEFPVYQHVTGNQLVAPVLFKLTVSREF